MYNFFLAYCSIWVLIVSMNTTRVGKIAHLPHETRELLNNRLLDGEPAVELVPWLNSLPEVNEVLLQYFNGRPITEQNLSEWKHGGYREWFTHQEALLYSQSLAVDAREITKTLKGSPSDHLAAVVATKYAVAIGQWDGQPNSALQKTLQTLGEICSHIEELRRGDHSAARVKLAQARTAIDGAKAEKHIFEKYREWVNQAEGWQFVYGPEGLTHEEQISRLANLLAGKDLSIPSPEPKDDPKINPTPVESNLSSTE
jgi:hypothetical protein